MAEPDIIEVFADSVKWFIAGELHLGGSDPNRRAIACKIIRDIADAIEANDGMKLYECRTAMIAFGKAAIATMEPPV
jgi:hypothetical protein